MNKLVVIAALCAAASLAHARPVIIEETSTFGTPDPNFYIGAGVAIDGDEAIVIGLRGFEQDEYWNTESTVFTFRRNGTNWDYVQRIGSGMEWGIDDANGYFGVALKNGVAALAILPLQIFELRNGTWVKAPVFDLNSPYGISSEYRGNDIVLDNGRIFFGGLSWGGIVVERNTAGEWRAQQYLYGDYSGLQDSSRGGAVDIAGNWAGIHDENNEDGLPAPAITLYRKTTPASNSWVQHSRLAPAEGHALGDVALRANPANGTTEMFAPDYAQFGTAVYEIDSSNNVYERQRMHSTGDWMGARSGFGANSGITKSDRYIFLQAWDYDRDAYVQQVFQPNTSGFYVHVATLVSSSGGSVGSISASGRRVLATGGAGVLYFELPETFDSPAPIQDTFATGNGAGWTAVPGSQWTVAQSGDTRVYRQSSTAGDAGAVLDAADWTSQSIQADVTPTAFNGNDRWVGLATRRTDAANYYYVTLRSSGIVGLKRMRNGVFANIASASVPVTLNRTYRLRLESVGTRHRVYIDGVPMLEASDGDLTHGHPALLTYRAAADFDNVVVTPGGTTTIYAQDQGWVCNPVCANREPWIYTGLGSWTWRYEGANLVLGQGSVASDARAAVGPLIDYILEPDQIVETRARLGTFGSGADPWFGVMARYRDESNYLYLSLRKSNTLSIRKLQNGQITQLGTVVQNVAPGTWYRLRLEAVGNRVRAYVNGKLVLEGTDPQPSSGRTGLLTYRTAADFDDFRAVRP